MKRYIHIALSVLTFFSLYACQSDDDALSKNKGELTLAPTVEQMKGVGSRAIGDDFFETGSEIEINLTTINSAGAEVVNSPYIYAYGADRIFRGNPGYLFTLDDSYIKTLTARWPTSDARFGGIKTDQRLLADYKASDWMSGGLTSGAESGIVATDAPVPLVFTRENVLLDFELVGQNTTGLNIESLLIELQTSDNSLAYWAYCDNPNGHAELILPAGSRILSDDNYLIGRIRVSGQTSDYTIIFPQTDLTLEAGHRYLITLTPQGYFMNAYVYIYGFAEAEEGIGIPFQQPTPNADGNFLINTPNQLITLSYLMRHYNDGTTFVWSTRTYIISDTLIMTAEDVDKYLPIPQSLFTGLMQNLAGEMVTEVPTADGNTLQLFDDNN